MNRVHPKELLEYPAPEDLSMFKKLALEEGGGGSDESKDRGSDISEFSWKTAINYVDKRLENHLGRSDMYFLDGRPIKDGSFLESITMEICQEYGFVANQQ